MERHVEAGGANTFATDLNDRDGTVVRVYDQFRPAPACCDHRSGFSKDAFAQQLSYQRGDGAGRQFGLVGDLSSGQTAVIDHRFDNDLPVSALDIF